MSWGKIDVREEEELIKSEIRTTFNTGEPCKPYFREGIHNPKELYERKSKVGITVEYWKLEDEKMRIIIGFMDSPQSDKIKILYISVNILNFRLFNVEDVDYYVLKYIDFIKMLLERKESAYHEYPHSDINPQLDIFINKVDELCKINGIIKTTEIKTNDYGNYTQVVFRKI